MYYQNKLPRESLTAYLKKLDNSLLVVVCVGLIAFFSILVVCLYTNPVDDEPSTTSASPTPVAPATQISWGWACEKEGCIPAALLFGEIPDDPDVLLKPLKLRPDVKTVCFQSNGGNSISASMIASWIHDNGYSTCLPSVESTKAVCTSACTSIFASGLVRRADPEVEFGIHRATIAALMKTRPDSFSAESGTIRGSCAFCQSFNSAIVETTGAVVSQLNRWRLPATEPIRTLLEKSSTVPGQNLRMLTSQELLAWKVITAPVDGELTWLNQP